MSITDERLAGYITYQKQLLQIADTPDDTDLIDAAEATRSTFGFSDDEDDRIMAEIGHVVLSRDVDRLRDQLEHRVKVAPNGLTPRSILLEDYFVSRLVSSQLHLKVSCETDPDTLAVFSAHLGELDTIWFGTQSFPWRDSSTTQ